MKRDLKKWVDLTQSLSAKLIGVCRALVDFVYPPFCILCDSRLGDQERLVCSSCWHNMPVLEQNLLNYSDDDRYYFKKSLAVWEYRDCVQELIHHFKYRGKSILGQQLGQAMGQLAGEYEEFYRADYLIPVPLHRRKLRERGYNQSLILARFSSTVIGIPVRDNVLKRIRYTRPQASLGAEARSKNVSGAFSINNNDDLKDKSIVLVDDVLTTGFTLNECARVLHNAGAATVMTITIARA